MPDLRAIDPAPVGGRYRLVRRLAGGGMGQVWRAVDDILGRPVAVKLLRSELVGDREFLDRFRNEGRRTAALSHPGSASVFDYGETMAPRVTAFLVMELVEGPSLAALLARERRLAADRRGAADRGRPGGRHRRISLTRTGCLPASHARHRHRRARGGGRRMPGGPTSEWSPVSMRRTRVWTRRCRAVALTAMLALAMLTTLFIGAAPQTTPGIVVPSLSGQRIATAGQRLVRAGFEVHQRTRPSQALKAGIVLAQNPAAGTRVERGAVVTLTVSTGPASWRPAAPQTNSAPRSTLASGSVNS